MATIFKNTSSNTIHVLNQSVAPLGTITVNDEDLNTDILAAKNAGILVAQNTLPSSFVARSNSNLEDDSLVKDILSRLDSNESAKVNTINTVSGTLTIAAGPNITINTRLHNNTIEVSGAAASGDNLGNHTATQALNMNGFAVNRIGSGELNVIHTSEPNIPSTDRITYWARGSFDGNLSSRGRPFRTDALGITQSLAGYPDPRDGAFYFDFTANVPVGSPAHNTGVMLPTYNGGAISLTGGQYLQVHTSGTGLVGPWSRVNQPALLYMAQADIIANGTAGFSYHGLMNDAGTTEFMGFRRAGGAGQNWFAVTTAAGTTATNSAVPADAGNYEFMMLYNNTNVKFWINGNLVATHTTNLPFGNLSIGAFVTHGGPTLRLDYHYVEQRRYFVEL